MDKVKELTIFDVFKTPCIYYCDCLSCMNYDNDARPRKCSVSGSVLFRRWNPCTDFKCGVPFEYCSGSCDR